MVKMLHQTSRLDWSYCPYPRPYPAWEGQGVGAVSNKQVHQIERPNIEILRTKIGKTRRLLRKTRRLFSKTRRFFSKTRRIFTKTHRLLKIPHRDMLPFSFLLRYALQAHLQAERSF